MVCFIQISLKPPLKTIIIHSNESRSLSYGFRRILIIHTLSSSKHLHPFQSQLYDSLEWFQTHKVDNMIKICKNKLITDRVIIPLYATSEFKSLSNYSKLKEYQTACFHNDQSE
ncbi:hypothetical protein FGO68_gene984 [Halteria grandinella]|uniref:Uncharacterized protein n=1 Tax=Halteria grandinella TaxID=5974 RepID=A0A8J8NTF2_HALGN|nr:hypothetical protein FGO68_gene984 [Halteria grandinella]